MNRYMVTTVVNFIREVEADSPEEAEQIGYYYLDSNYDSVESVEVEELDEDEEV